LASIRLFAAGAKLTATEGLATLCYFIFIFRLEAEDKEEAL
jgi:hypothetical protein